MPITSSPCETFRWRDRTGNLHSPATLATEDREIMEREQAEADAAERRAKGVEH